MFDDASFKRGGKAIFAYLPCGNEISYVEASQLINGIVDDLGSRSSEVCLFLFESSIEAIFVYLGLLRKGVVPLLLSPNIKSSAICRFKDLYGCELIAGPAETLEDYGDSVVATYGTFCVKRFNTGVCTESDDYECALLLATSGSTGEPKVAMLSQSNIQVVSLAIVESLAITSRDVLATSLPLYYSYGLSIIHCAVACHAAIAPKEFKLLDKAYWRSLEDRKVSVFSAVPVMLENISKLGALKCLPTSLRVLTVAGGRLEKSKTLEYLDLSEDRGFSFVTMYGATEASPRMGYVPPANAREKLGSAGIAISGGEFSIKNCDANGVGDIVYTGKNVFLGYANGRQDLNKPDQFLGVLPTGDVGFLDKDRFLNIVGRKKRIAKLQGIRLNLDHVENLLSDYGVPSMALEYKDRLIIMIKSKSDTDVMAILKSEISADIKFKLVEVEEFPLNERGKKDYSMASSLLNV